MTKFKPFDFDSATVKSFGRGVRIMVDWGAIAVEFNQRLFIKVNPMHQIQITDEVYQQAQRCASEAGFSTVDEFISQVVISVLSEETENYDEFFTPEVIADLDRVADSLKAGAKAYTSEAVDEHFRRKSQAWRDAHPS